MFRKKWGIAGMMIGVLMLMLALTAIAQTNIEAVDAPFVSQDDLHLTVYQNDVALVRDTRTYQLEAGLNRVTFSGVAGRLLRDTVAFSVIDGTDEIYVVEQGFATAEPPFNIDTLIAQNIGETVNLTVLNRNSDEDDFIYEGVLLSTSGGVLVLQLADNTIITVNRSEVREFRLPEMGSERIEVPTLELLVNSPQAGEHALTITYLSDGMSWGNSNYNLNLSANGDSLDVTGWITLSNNSGVAFDNARVTLGGGNLDRLQFVTRDLEFATAPTATAIPTQTPSPNTGGSAIGLYAQPQQPVDFLLDLSRTVTLPMNDSLLVEFLGGTVSDPRNTYIYDASPRVFGYNSFIINPDYGQTDITSVQNFLTFSTGGENSGGIALPAGNMRVYQQDETDASLLVGQTQLAYTPAGETIRVFLENPESLMGERTQAEFVELSTNAIQETIEIRLINNGETDLEIIVPERMTRWSNWEILGASVPFEQSNAFGVEFVVSVPAGEESLISYTVLYTNAG